MQAIRLIVAQSCLVLLIHLLHHVGLSQALVLPENAYARSRYLHTVPARRLITLVNLEEFVDLSAGQARFELDVKLGRDWMRSQQVLSYFWFAQQFDENDSDDELILHEPEANACSLESSSDWPLNELSKLLKLALDWRPKEQTDAPRPATSKERLADRLLIGPLGLLSGAYRQAKLFKRSADATSKLTLEDNYYFATDLLDLSEDVKVKLVVVLPTRSVKGSQEERVESIRDMSQVEASEHPSIVAIFKAATQQEVDFLNSVTAHELLEPDSSEANMNLERIVVMFNSIEPVDSWWATSLMPGRLNSQQVDLDHHLGSPFSLPSLNRCGSLLPPSSMLFIKANQFSARFKAKHFHDEFFIAFDEISHQLRLETIGKHSLIYSQFEHSITMISESPTQQAASGPAQVLVGHQAHCAQLLQVLGEQAPELLHAKSMSWLLGAGAQVGLAYLGLHKLDDEQAADLVCHAYEREVNFASIPLLLLVFSPFAVQPNERFFVEFCMQSSEYAADQVQSSRGEPTLVLHQLRLVSLNSRLKQRIVRSQITFDQFSWSLEQDVSSDDSSEADRSLSGVFDTLECSPQMDRTKIEFKLAQTSESDWLFSSQPRPNEAMQQFQEQMFSFKMELGRELGKKLHVELSKLNQLQVELAHEIEPGSDSSSDNNELLVSLLLSKPLECQHSIVLLGWILQAESATVATFDGPNSSSSSQLAAAQMLSLSPSARAEECALLAAVELESLAEQRLLHCPLYGCGYIRSFKWKSFEASRVMIARTDAEGASNSEPSLAQYPHMCRVYLMRRRTVSSSYYHVRDRLEAALKGQLRIARSLFRRDPGGSTQPSSFVANLEQVSISSGLNHEQWDRQVASGFCLTIKSKLRSLGSSDVTPTQAETADEAIARENLAAQLNEALEIVQLDFDRHHSLRHCHQACLLKPFCSSYSYSRSARQCTLTNLDLSGDFLKHFQVDNLLQDASCELLQLNQILRYKSKMASLLMQPASLMSHTKIPLLITDLEHCANLCQLQAISISETSSSGVAPNRSDFEHCNGFIYIPSHSICTLIDWTDDLKSLTSMLSEEDSTSPAKVEIDSKLWANYHFFDRFLEHSTQRGSLAVLHSKNELDSYLGAENASEQPSHCLLYERDHLGQHFLNKRDVRLEIKQSGAAQKMTDIALVAQGSDKIATFLGCARECATVDEHCLAFDYSIESQPKGLSGSTSYERKCLLYHFRSPFSFEQSGLLPDYPQRLKWRQDSTPSENRFLINELDKRIYSRLNQDIQLQIGRSIGWHYYMNENQIELRRQLASGATNSAAALVRIETHESGENNEHRITRPSVEFGRKKQGASGSISLYQLLLGFVAGFTCYVGILAYIRFQELQPGANNWPIWPLTVRRGTGRDRSMSTMELAEVELEEH